MSKGCVNYSIINRNGSLALLCNRMNTRAWTYLSALPLVIAYLFSLNHPFFWDTTHLSSEQAQWFFQHHLSTLLLPDRIDSGHPPLTGWLLALTWTIFGKGLLQSHLMLLPFLALLISQSVEILIHFFGDRAWMAGILFFLNPTLVAQGMLVSPDIILFSGFFFCLHGILVKKNMRILAGAFILASVSMRGMMCVAALFIFQQLLHKNLRTTILSIPSYLPAASIAALFLWFHYSEKGWIGYHPGSPWAPAFEPVSLMGFAKNVLVFVWRISDQGMFFVWLLPLFHWSWVSVKHDTKFRSLLLLASLLFMLLVLPQLFYKHLLMHRYLFPLAAVMMITVLYGTMAASLGKPVRRIIVTTLLMLTGYAWVYPDPISKGWDAMPLHVFSFKPRAAILERMEVLKVAPAVTGAAFPYNMKGSVIDLSNDDREFAPLDLDRNKYVLYSNLSNDFSDDQLRALKNWKPLARSGGWPVHFILYQQP